MTTGALSLITKDEFEVYDACCRLFTHEGARCFAQFELPEGGRCFVVSWCSDLFSPTSLDDPDRRLFWVGIDERIAAVRYSGQIHFSVGLASHFMAIELRTNVVVVICEFQAIVIAFDGSVRRILEFPDLVRNYCFIDEQLSVLTMDGQRQVYSVDL